MFLLNFLLLCINFLSLSFIKAEPTLDKVSNLPGINFQPNFNHYSGYLKASSTRNYHYWFTKAQYETTSTPVILWLSGGPGCSSLAGLLEELGPFHVKDNGDTVYENVYAWNKFGHVLFLESPAGVGFSFATDGNITTDDDQVATDNYNALIDFFTNKFPELKSNDFYITGESYGGVYVPTLAVLVANDQKNFPTFKGIAIGNGLYHEKLNVNTKIPLYFYHGIMRQSLYDQVAEQCCHLNMYSCDFYSLLNDTNCKDLVSQMLSQAEDLDPYNLYSVCYLDGGSSSKRAYINKFINKNINKASMKQAAGLPLCAQIGNNSVIYLNRPEVRTALHIPNSVPAWQNCNEQFWKTYTIKYFDMTNHFKILLSKNARILIYNGDVDTVCSVIMNEKFISQLNLTIQNDNPLEKHPWYYNDSVSQNGACCNYLSNVAGYYTLYNEGLNFVTIRGSGHFANEDKPRESLQMIYNYVFQQNYSTPVPFNTLSQPSPSPITTSGVARNLNHFIILIFFAIIKLY